MKKSTDLQKPSFLAIEWDSRLLPDALGVVDGDVDPKPSRSQHSLPMAFAVLHVNEVLAKLEPLSNFFLDHRAVERLACSLVFLSELIGHVLYGMFEHVLLVLESSSLGLYWSLSFPALAL